MLLVLANWRRHGSWCWLDAIIVAGCGESALVTNALRGLNIHFGGGRAVNSERNNMECPTCGNETANYLGQLGHYHYFRCCACGMEFKGSSPFEASSEESEEDE